MDSFYKKYAIALLLFCLKQKFSFAHAENLTLNEQTIHPKTGYLNIFKVPWINSNNKWINETESRCGNDVVTLFEKADSGEKWALQMLDATSKIPAGILLGNILDLGMYDECIGAKSRHINSANIEGQHCMVSLSIPSKFVQDAAAMLFIQKVSIYNPSAGIDPSLTLSVCLPSSCGVKDVIELVNASIQTMPELHAFEVNVVRVTCSGGKLEDSYTPGKILTLSFFVIIASLLLFCTVCDFVVKKTPADSTSALKTFAKFSLYTNAIKLLSTKVTNETMPAINGLRFISTCVVVTGHRVLSSIIRPTANLADIIEWRRSVVSTIAFSLPRVVDTFFVVAGFLTAHSLLKALHSGRKINIPMLYLHRYLRLTPCLIVFLLFGIFIYPDLGSGPIWETIMAGTSDYCKKNWWTNLLYVNNFVNRHEMCMPPTWYLAADMQLFWICPIILYPLHYNQKLGLTFSSMIIITSLVAPSIQIAVNQWPAMFDLNSKSIPIGYENFIDSYMITYNRALPYLIGILLGNDVVHNKRQVKTKQVIFNWILTCIIFLLCIWASYFAGPISIIYNVVWEIAHVTVVRLGWSIAVAWILYACTQGYGGPLTTFLSSPVFVPLSRLGYSIYWVHFFLQLWTNATLRIPAFFSPLADIYPIGSDLAISIAVAFVITVCFETPIIVLEKHFMTKKQSAVEKHDSLQQTVRKDSTIIKNHSDSARTEICSDLTHEERTLKMIAEWATIWQKWKSEVLDNDSRRNIRQQFEYDSVKYETGITELEKEFLIFLTAISCHLDHSAGCDESEILESARSKLGFDKSRDKDYAQLSRLKSTSLTKKTK